MTDSPQRKTTSSGRRTQHGLYLLDSPPHADHISLNLEQIGRRFGWVVIMSPIRLYTRGWSCCYVHVACTGCGTEKWCSLSNLEQRKSTGCLACERPRHMGPSWLYHRLQAAKDRCTTPNNPAWLRYGGRGIEFRFGSISEACEYVVTKLGLPNRAMEIDRRDNNGHYERGNIRWATGRQNRRNTRRCKYPAWNPNEWPYAKNPVWRRLAAGMTREQIIADAWKAVAEKRKNWRGIRDKLLSMTS